MKILIQLSKYGGVAVGSAATDYAIFSSLYFLFNAPLPAQMAARIGGGIFSFALNKYWIFQSKSKYTILKEWRRFLILYAFSYAMSISIMYVLMSYFSVSAYPAKITADISCFILNFIVMKLYVFSERVGLSAFTKVFTKPH